MNVASGTAAADALMTEAGQQARPEHSGRRHSALEHLLSEVLGRLGWQRDPAVFDSALPPQGALDTLDDASMLLNGLCLPSEVGSAPPRTWLDGGWHFPSRRDPFRSDWPAPRPLYRLPELERHPWSEVLITEGEKAADAAACPSNARTLASRITATS